MCPPKPKIVATPPVQQAPEPEPVVAEPPKEERELMPHEKLATSPSGGGGGTTIIEKETPKLQVSEDDADAEKVRGRRRTSRQRRVGSESDTLVTGGAGVLGKTTAGSKELLGA